MSFRKKAQKKPLTGLRDIGQDITPESPLLCQGCSNGTVLTRLHGSLLCGQETGREDPRGNTEGKKASHLMAPPRSQGMGEVSLKKQEKESWESMTSKHYENMITTAHNKLHFDITIYHVP